MINLIETEITKIVDKLRQIEVEISAQKGDFTLFALIEREDALGKWDIIVSANWIKNQDKILIKTIAAEISENLTLEEQIILSRIIVLPPQDPFVQNLNMFWKVTHGMVKLSNDTFNGIRIKEAYLITSNPS